MVKKKVIIIGSDHEAALELVYMSLLVKNGCIVDLFPAQSLFLNYYHSSFFNKLLYRFGLSCIISNIQVWLKIFVDIKKPDVVIVFKGMEVTRQTLNWIRGKDIRLYNYNPDHPFIFSGSGSGNRNVRRSIMAYDCYFTYAEDVVNGIHALGVPSVKIPFGFDSDGIKYEKLEAHQEILKICFIGNADKNRVEFLNTLAKLGSQIDVFGENWHEFILDKSIVIGPALYGNEFWINIQRYAVQLNLLRQHNTTSHNMRSFDIPGGGGVMLAPYTIDHASYFNEDIDVFLFRNVQEAFDKSIEILSLDFEERSKIRALARTHSLKNHTYSLRVDTLLHYVLNH